MEDAFAHHPDDRALAGELADDYLGLKRPHLAIAVLRSAAPGLLEDPSLTHRLSRAYEASGRLRDALATADLALSRCARSLGTSSASSATPVPRFRCGASEYVMLDMHRAALAHMVAWGVTDPRHDPRTQVAYELAVRHVRIASAQ